MDNIIPECYFDPIVDSDYMDHCIGSDNHIHENWGFGGNNQDKDKTRVIVCGGRDFTDYKYLSQTLDEYLQQYKNVEIVSGHAKGADTFGEKYAEEHGIPCSVFPANWKDNGRIAGLIRNSKMIDYAMDGKPLVIAFWDGKSHGTKDTIRKAGIKNIPCIIAGYNGYDINSMIENAIEGCSGCLMWVAYELGYYDSFHKIPESKIINDEAKFYYLRGYQETKKENFYNRHLEKFGFRSTSELILENARSTMIGEKGCNAWGDNEENE